MLWHGLCAHPKLDLLLRWDSVVDIGGVNMKLFECRDFLRKFCDVQQKVSRTSTSCFWVGIGVLWVRPGQRWWADVGLFTFGFWRAAKKKYRENFLVLSLEKCLRRATKAFHYALASAIVCGADDLFCERSRR